VQLDDVAALADLVCRNRRFMAPWDPVRPEEYFTVEGQRAVVEVALEEYRAGRMLPHLILDGDEQVVGRITLNGIVRGPFQSCSVGYWVNEESNRRGLATVALAHITRVAFDEMGLHRLQAETLVHNVGSKTVLERNGFEWFGLAPAYLEIAGLWQDHDMYQLVRSGD
jgi:ribosomal-protein-alanine N-acetyltransferase